MRSKKYSKLTPQAKNFIQQIEDRLGVEVVLIGTGAEINDIIDRRTELIHNLSNHILSITNACLNKPLYSHHFNNVILERRALQIKSPFFIEVSTIQDFGRLVCAFERTPLLTFSFKSAKDDLLATQIDFLNNIHYLLRKISK